jgi:hypothetical protein
VDSLYSFVEIFFKNILPSATYNHTDLAELYTITSEWTEQQWFSTGGTRAKKYLLAPDRKYYYFKRSQFKPGKDFKYEFWNEIISYETGTLLGFKMLRYDIAIDGSIMGCISESMINPEDQELIEGVKYLQAYLSEFDPAKKEHRTWYSFDLITAALEKAHIGQFTEDILELIVLDAIIGNGDRHQENWAIIAHHQLFKEGVNDSLIPYRIYKVDRFFAPIYDSGSSLGRELLPDKVELFLNSEEQLKSYITRGTSEIHWKNKKLSHFELIRNLLSTSHKENLTKIIHRVITKFEASKIEQILEEIDQKVPETHIGYKIPIPRKRLIYKLITLRFEMLSAIINERV